MQSKPLYTGIFMFNKFVKRTNQTILNTSVSYRTYQTTGTIK
jgi:hypothetical protein